MDNAIAVKFSDFETSDLFTSYAYDIDDAMITEALGLLKSYKIFRLLYSEIHKDWQAACDLEQSSIVPDYMKHALRIAMLVMLIKNGRDIVPVEIDTFSRSCSHLEGHHRLLALKYLGYDTFPAYLSGYVDELEEQLNVCMGN
jgi:hypothetical protein